MTTRWTKNAKETFTDSSAPDQTPDQTPDQNKMETTNGVADFGNDVYIGKDSDELILMSNRKDIDSSTTPTPSATAPSSLKDKLKDLKTDFNLGKANDVWQNMVNASKKVVGHPHKKIAKKMLAPIHSDFESPAAKNDLNSLSSQISRWFKVVIASYIVALNLWYLWCYTNFTFDLRSLIFLPPNPILAPAINAFEAINYYFLNMRMDSEPKLPFGLGTEDIRNLWHWRPVTFSILHFVLIIMFLSSSLSKEFSSIFSLATKGTLYVLAMALAFYYYAVLYKTWYKIPLSLSPGVVGLLLLIAATILTVLFVPIAVPICLLLFTMYLTFLSNTSLFAFNWFWPPSIFSSIVQIFQELKEAPVYDEDPPEWSGKVGNYLFQNFHNIYLVVIVLLPLLIWNITESAKFSNQGLVAIGISVNIMLFLLFSWSGVKDVFVLIAKLFSKSESAPDPTETAPDGLAAASAPAPVQNKTP